MSEVDIESVTVTTADLYSVPNFNGKLGFCARGARLWFSRHELDWTTFVRLGLPAATFLATGDAMAKRLVDHAVARCK